MTWNLLKKNSKKRKRHSDKEPFKQTSKKRKCHSGMEPFKQTSKKRKCHSDMERFKQNSKKRKRDSDADCEAKIRKYCFIHDPDFINNPLPDDLEWRRDENGIPYFIDTNYKTTSREDPRTPLPSSWEKRYKRYEGQTYFVNRNTGQATWQHPFCRCTDFQGALERLPDWQHFHDVRPQFARPIYSSDNPRWLPTKSPRSRQARSRDGNRQTRSRDSSRQTRSRGGRWSYTRVASRRRLYHADRIMKDSKELLWDAFLSEGSKSSEEYRCLEEELSELLMELREVDSGEERDCRNSYERSKSSEEYKRLEELSELLMKLREVDSGEEQDHRSSHERSKSSEKYKRLTKELSELLMELREVDSGEERDHRSSHERSVQSGSHSR